MSRFARVDSIDAIKELRITLCKFAETVGNGLDEAETEIRRTGLWLENEQKRYWKDECRKRAELLTRAKIELKKKKLQKTPLGGRPSCVEEEKAFKLAKRRFEESEQKLAEYRRKEGLMEDTDTKDVSSDKVRQLNAAITEADLKLTRAKSDLNDVADAKSHEAKQNQRNVRGKALWCDSAAILMLFLL